MGAPGLPLGAAPCAPLGTVAKDAWVQGSSRPKKQVVGGNRVLEAGACLPCWASRDAEWLYLHLQH